MGLAMGRGGNCCRDLTGRGIQCVDFGSQCSLCGFSFSSQLRVTYYTVTAHDHAFLRRGQGAKRKYQSRQVLDVLKSMSEQRANVAHEPSASYEDRVKSLLNFDH